MPVTPAENLQLLCSGREPHWVPFTTNVGAIPGLTPPILKRFRAETGADDPDEYFGCDYRLFSLRAHYGGTDPRSRFREPLKNVTFDEWGIGHWSGGGESTVDRLFHPLEQAESIREVETLPKPIIEVPSDLTMIADFKKRGYPVFGYGGSIYEWSWWLRGMERFMEDLLLAPDMAEAVVRKVTDYTLGLAQASARAGIDVLCFYDDAGMQTGMQISPELWRKFIKPNWKRVLETVRSQSPNVRFFLHSCGRIRDIAPDIVEVGFDILHPIQPECMDVAEVHRQFGKNIALCATLSAQRIFPFGSPADVRREVQRLKRVCGPGKRFILSPSNLIQPETPWENIRAFVEEARAGRI